MRDWKGREPDDGSDDPFVYIDGYDQVWVILPRSIVYCPIPVERDKVIVDDNVTCGVERFATGIDDYNYTCHGYRASGWLTIVNGLQVAVCVNGHVSRRESWRPDRLAIDTKALDDYLDHVCPGPRINRQQS